MSTHSLQLCQIDGGNGAATGIIGVQVITAVVGRVHHRRISRVEHHAIEIDDAVSRPGKSIDNGNVESTVIV